MNFPFKNMFVLSCGPGLPAPALCLNDHGLVVAATAVPHFHVAGGVIAFIDFYGFQLLSGFVRTGQSGDFKGAEHLGLLGLTAESRGLWGFWRLNLGIDGNLILGSGTYIALDCRCSSFRRSLKSWNFSSREWSV